MDEEHLPGGPVEPRGDGTRGASPATAMATEQAGAIMRGVPLRVCAELGRAAMPLASAVGLPPGEVVELDRGADDPVDLYVNGRRFATGRVVLVEDEWAVRVEEVFLDPGGLS